MQKKGQGVNRISNAVEQVSSSEEESDDEDE